ncbi:unnamed protein product, partial [Scytosiphon promiscuus]
RPRERRATIRLLRLVCPTCHSSCVPCFKGSLVLGIGVAVRLEEVAEREMGEPSSVAASQGRTVLKGKGEKLLELMSKVATSTQWAEWLRAPLEHAAANGDKSLTQCLLEAGANGGAGWKGCDDRTLLQAAAEGGNQEIVSALLENGGLAELDAVSGEKEMTALHRASERGHTAVARVLMVEGADASLLDSRQRSALHYAAEGGNSQLFQDLMIAGVDVDVKDVVGDTPLHLATANGHAKIVSSLLRRGGESKVANCEGKHALHLAVDRRDVGMVKHLLKAGANPNVRYGDSNMCSPLYLGVKDAEMTRTLLKHGADVKSTDTLGYTALHWAADEGGSAVIDALVENGADLEARSSVVILRDAYTSKGLTPLHVAAFWHRLEGMASLLHNGASIQARDDDGLTPLHVVCKGSLCANSVKAADLLLRRGADETVADKSGRLAGDLLKDSGGVDLSCESLKRLLLKAPADRAWRRRGMLVMCRSRPDKLRARGQEERAEKNICQEKGSGTDAVTAAAGDAGEDDTFLLARLMTMDDAAFGSIVGFM